MNKIKLTLIIILVLLTKSNLEAQLTDDELINRYWTYKDRFLKQYTYVGKDNGESTVIIKKTNETRSVIDKNNGNTITYTGKMEFGDALVDQGLYICVLATEYRLLKDAGLDVTSVSNELYYAIEAINRLDENAEWYYGGNKSKNGFFIRTDAPDGFYERYEEAGDEVHFQGSEASAGRKPYNKATISGVEYWVDIDGNYIIDDGKLNDVYTQLNGYESYVTGKGYGRRSNEMSQDQLYGVMLGLGFVLKFVDNVYIQPKKPGISTDPDRGFNLVDESKLIIERIMDNLATVRSVDAQHDGLEGFVPGGKDIATVETNYMAVNTFKNKAVDRGPLAAQMGFIYPLRLAAIRLLGYDKNSWEPTGNIKVTYKKDHFTFLPIISSPLPITYGVGYIYKEGVTYTFPIKPQQATYWAEFGNSSILPFFNRNHIYKLGTLANIIDQQDFYDFCTSSDFMDDDRTYIELINAVFNEHTPINNRGYYKTVLSSSYCDGNSQIGNSRLEYGSVEDMWSFNQYKDKKTGELRQGEWNALDWMLLHNLYRISFKNVIENKFTNKFCPCKSSKQFYTNNSTSNPHLTNLNELKNDIIFRFPAYKDYNISIPEWLTKNYTINNNGDLNPKGDLTICNSNTIIENGGKLSTSVNSNSSWFKVINVSKNSTLEIKAGGRLIIENNTKVVIEEGAKLIYHPGARIILNGTNAVLEINQGQLVLQPNAIFQIEAGANGRGYVHVHHDWKPATQGSKIDPPSIVSLGSGCIVHLDGVLNSSPWNYNNDKLLKVSGNVGLVTDDKLEVLRCSYGYLALDKNTQIVSNAKYSDFNNLVVNYLENTSSNLTTKHNGIQINGTRNKFNQIKFSNANYCIRFISPEGSYGGILSLSNIEANNTCINGVKQHGGSIDAINCIFRTTIKPANIQATHIPSYVRLSEFNAQNILQNNGEAFSIHGKGWFYSFKSVYSYSFKAMQVRDCRARFTCNDFQNSRYNVRLTNSPEITLFKGYNLFNSGTLYNHIWSSGNTNLRINEGYNFFSKIDNPFNPANQSWGPLKVFDFELSKINQLTPTTNPTIPLEFNIKNNYIFYVNSPSNNMLVPRPDPNYNYLAYTYELPERNISLNQDPNLYTNIGNINSHIFDFNDLKQQFCNVDPMDKGNNINPKKPGMTASIWGSNPTELIRPVNPPLVPIPVNTAPIGTPNNVQNIADVVNNNIRRVINATDSSLDSTINELNYVLTNNQNNLALHQYPNSLELFYSYQLLNEALSIKVALIDSAEADSIKSYDKIMPYVPATVNTMQTLWNSTNDETSFWKNYKYQIATDWAQVHRLANQRPQAINVLQTSLLSITHPVEDMGISKWICINEAEHKYLTDSVKNWDSIIVQYPCLDQEVDENILQMMLDQYHSGNNTPPPGYQLQKEKDINELFDLAMYPNPANNSVNIEIKQGSEMQKIVLYDMKGLMVFNSEDIKLQSTTIDISNLPDGYYIVQIISNNKVYQRKLSIVR